MEKTVEAVICGHEITSAEVDAFIASLPREQQVYASHPDFRKQCVDQLIAVYALAKYGEEEKLDETEKFKAILENARKDILAQMAIGKIFEGITISDEEIREYFEANKARFAKGASVHAKHILVDSEDKCNELLESIVSGGKAFEDVAKESSTCPSGANGGDLGEFGKGQMVKEFEDAAFAAEIGHVVGPVKTQFGYHLIKVEDKKEAEDAKLDDVKEQIKSEIMQKKQQEAYTAKVEELKKKYFPLCPAAFLVPNIIIATMIIVTTVSGIFKINILTNTLMIVNPLLMICGILWLTICRRVSISFV